MKDLTLTEKAILGSIIGLSNLNGYCYAKNEDFAGLAGITERGVRKILEHLKDKKMIKVEVKRHHRKEIKEGEAEFGTERKIFPLVFSGKDEGGGTTVPTGEEQKFLYNNKRNNISNYNYPKVNNYSSYRKTLHSQLKRCRELEENPDFAELASELVLYYQSKYQKVLGVPHPRYKYEQIADCFLTASVEIERLFNGGYTLEEIQEITRKAVDYWFETATNEQNNLLMNHFLRGNNSCLFNCISEVV